MPADELLEIKERAAALLMRRPGVTAVGIGGRERGGRPTGELAIKVFVARKRPLTDVPADEVIPAEFEGVPTDVEPMAEGELLGAPDPPTGKPEIPESDIDDRRRRPLLGGIQIKPALRGAGRGTLGCFLEEDVEAPEAVYALTNWHVVAGRDHNNQVVAPTAGDTEVGQPTNGSSSTQCCNDIVGTFAAGSMDGVRDAAAIKLVPGTRWQADIAEIGAVRGSHAIVEDDLDPGPYQVRKRGIRSGLTGGRVLSINSTYTAMGRIFRNAIIVRFDPDPGQPSGPQLYFAQRGDSGSALVNDANEVVGLMFAATLKGPDANAIGNAAAIPLEDVFDRFGDDGLTLRLATAPRPGVVRTVPGAVEQGTPAALAEPAAIPACVAGSERPSREDFVRLRADLERSAAGRRLTAAWLAHHHELLALVDKNRRVTVGWHRGGGPALVQLGLRALSDPDLTLPRTLRDRPLAQCLDLIAETFTRYGSEPLRAAVADARAMLPDLAGRSYRQVIDGLDAG